MPDHGDMRPPVEVKQPYSMYMYTARTTQLYRILTHAIKLTFLRHLRMLYQHTLSVLKSKYILTLIRRK